MPAISQAKTPPTRWKDSHTAYQVPRIIFERVRRAALHVSNRIDLSYQLKILIDRKIGRSLQDQLIGSVQERRLKSVDLHLNVGVEMVANIRRNIHVLA